METHDTEKKPKYELTLHLYYREKEHPISIYIGKFRTVEEIEKKLNDLITDIGVTYDTYIKGNHDILYQGFKNDFVTISNGWYSVVDLIAVDYTAKKIKKDKKKENIIDVVSTSYEEIRKIIPELPITRMDWEEFQRSIREEREGENYDD